MSRYKEKYKNEIIPKLVEEFGYKNNTLVPRLEKIVINIGMGELSQQKDLVDSIRDELATIAGQKPVITRAKLSISNFKIREGMPVGYKVTLRSDRMYNFLDRLINFVIPRIRDFRGVSDTAFDSMGNYTMGIKEQSIFPELELDKVSISHGMDISFVTSCKTKKEAMALLKSFNMPFVKR